MPSGERPERPQPAPAPAHHSSPRWGLPSPCATSEEAEAQSFSPLPEASGCEEAELGLVGGRLTLGFCAVGFVSGTHSFCLA